RWVTWSALLVVIVTARMDAAESTFRVSGAVERPGEWTVSRLTADLAGSVQTVRFTMKGVEHTAKCVPLWALIEAVRPRVDPNRKNHRVGFAIILRARDGYTVAFSLAELAPDIGDHKVWLAVEVDGKPLAENEAPVRLLIPGEGNGHYHRWTFGI